MRDLFAFDLVHPAIQLGCFAAILAFSMAAIHPVFLSVSFLAASSFSIYLRGWRASLQMLAWQIPLVVLIACVNPIFSSVGATELFRIGTKAVYLESVAYGAFMGLMLISVMLWFSNASHVLSSDKVMAVFGNTVPTIGLMVSMAMRLVPQFVERGQGIASTMQACSAAAPADVKDKASARIRLVSVLVGWSMEDSLETADAMRARAWGSSAKRTTYQRYRFTAHDLFVAIVLILLVCAAALLVGVALSQFRFYPTMSQLVFWWGYIPYTLFMFLPLLACLADDFRWRDRL